MFLNILDKLRFFKKKREKSQFEEFICGLNIDFSNISLYKTAFRHRSVIPENSSIESNEILEFLGDSVLNLIVSNILFNQFPQENEGFLTSLKSKIVSRKYLNELATKLSLEEYIETRLKDTKNSNILGNTLEALIGAIYLDKGFDYTKYFFYKNIYQTYIDPKKVLDENKNYKSLLLEWGQKNKISIEFRFLNSQKNGNNQMFEMAVFVNESIVSKAVALSKKEAEQKAAKKSYYILTNK